MPWTIGVVTPHLPSGVIKSWDPRIRPLPGNIRLYSSVEEAMREDSWDWTLAHNIHDLIDFQKIALPKVFLVHGTLSGRILQDQSKINRTSYISNLRLLLAASGSRVVYISELKRRDWGIAGEILPPAIDSREYGGYRGEIQGILQVCNHLKERGAMMGWSTHQAVCKDLPTCVLGDNPGLPFSRMSADWEDLKEQLRAHRVYLYTPIYPYEDGYNLALLEAMATGMPIATLKNATSPVRDGSEGMVASTAEELREKVIALLNDPAEALRLGSGARIKVELEFPISRFRQAWESFVSKLI